MVVTVYTLILLFLLPCQAAFAGEVRPRCLGCHGAHFSGLGSCTACHKGNPASDRRNIAHYRLIAGRYARFALEGDQVGREGRRLVKQFACRRCHVTAGTGNRLATPLDSITDRKTPEELAVAIRAPGTGMPDFRLREQQVTALVNGVLWGAKRQGTTQAQLPAVVHFNAAGRGGMDVFSRKCGPCHTALTLRHGLTGSGNSGQNLSGLLSEWYPLSYQGRGVWSEQRLWRWLENPRTVRPMAGMQPVGLTAGEFRELLDVLAVAPAKDR